MNFAPLKSCVWLWPPGTATAKAPAATAAPAAVLAILENHHLAWFDPESGRSGAINLRMRLAFLHVFARQNELEPRRQPELPEDTLRKQPAAARRDGLAQAGFFQRLEELQQAGQALQLRVENAGENVLTFRRQILGRIVQFMRVDHDLQAPRAAAGPSSCRAIAA